MFCAITHSGIEDITSLELKEMNIDSEQKDSYVLFNTEIETAQEFAYKAQSIKRVLEILHTLKLKTIKDIEKDLSKIKINIKDKTFAVRCKREGDHLFQSNEVERLIGAHIHDTYNLKVDLEDPELLIYVFIKENNCIIGIDQSGFDLSKRTYSIFTTRQTLKGNIAYALTRISGFNKKGFLLDPFLKAGHIPIEAALFASNKSPHFFNKEDFRFMEVKEEWDNDDGNIPDETTIRGFDANLKHIKQSQKNAKIAGINKNIKLSRVETDWLDTKCEKEEVNHMVTYPPQVSRIHSEKEISKIYEDLFYAADYIINKKGKITIICSHPEIMTPIAEKFKFTVDSERDIFQGQEVLHIINYVKTLSS